MTIILEKFQIESPADSKSYAIELVEGLDQQHIEYIETEWGPILVSQYDLALLQFHSLPKNMQTYKEWVEILDNSGSPDKEWDWGLKCKFAKAENNKTYGLLNSGHVEAAMVLKFDRSSHSSAGNTPIVYIDSLAVAPWNRKVIQNLRRFGGLGTVMMGAAVEVSSNLNLEGRCGLHALPSAEDFYQEIGMKCLFVDSSYQNLKYFEFDTQAAMNFINKQEGL